MKTTSAHATATTPPSPLNAPRPRPQNPRLRKLVLSTWCCFSAAFGTGREKGQLLSPFHLGSSSLGCNAGCHWANRSEIHLGVYQLSIHRTTLYSTRNGELVCEAGEYRFFLGAGALWRCSHGSFDIWRPIMESKHCLGLLVSNHSVIFYLPLSNNRTSYSHRTPGRPREHLEI
jgi:hypothetical protein